MKISVAIAAYNAADYLRQAINSVLAQTVPPFEIIIVDDGSKDHTRQVCESFGHKVRYFYRENDGTAGIGARWQSINEARGEWIGLLDHDDLWRPAKLERQTAAVETFPNSGVVFTRYCSIDEQGVPLEVCDPAETSGRFIKLEPHDALHHLLIANPYCPSSALVLRSVLLDCGPPDPASCGDWSDWFRITDKYPMVVVDEYLTEYRTGASHFCADKDQLARRMQHTLTRQRARLRPGCADCRAAFQKGKAHVAQVFSVAARAYLDRYHEATDLGDTVTARSLMREVIRTAPREVLQPRRLAAASKNYAKAVIKKKRQPRQKND